MQKKNGISIGTVNLYLDTCTSSVTAHTIGGITFNTNLSGNRVKLTYLDPENGFQM